MNIVGPTTHKRSHPWLLLSIIGFILFLVVGVGYWFIQSFITLDDARLLHTDILLTAPTFGKVATVHVAQGQRVKKGDPLYTLDPTPLQNELEKAFADLSSIAATLPVDVLQELSLPKGIALDEALALSRTKEARARKSFEAARTLQATANYEATRAQTQYSRGRIKQEQLTTAKDALPKAAAALDSAKTELEKAHLAHLALKEEIQHLRASVLQSTLADKPVATRVNAYKQQLAVLQAAQTRLTHALEHSPKDGIVSELFIAPGASIVTGQAYMKFGVVGEMLPLIIGYTTSAKSARIKKGQTCKIALPNVGSFNGIVESIARVTQPPFPSRKGSNSTAPNGYFVVQIRVNTTTTYEFAALPELSLATVSINLRD